VLSLTVAIVGVRFFALTRPVTRYLERLASHDVALRSLGNARARVYERIAPLAPAQLQDRRHGDLLARLVADVDSLQNLYLRGLLPPVVAVAAGAGAVGVVAAILPVAALVLAAGLLVAGIGVPVGAAAIAARSSRQQASARGALGAELVETLAGGEELVLYGRRDDRLERLRVVDGTLVRVARRAAAADGTGDGLRLLVTGLTVTGVLAVAVSAHAGGGLDRVLIALLALAALAAFEAVQPLPEALRQLRVTVAAGERLLELVDQEPAVVDSAEPLPAPQPPFTIELEDVSVRYAPGERLALDDLRLRLDPGRRIALLGRSGSGKTTVANLLLRFVDPESPSPATTCASTGSRTCAARSPSRARTRTCSRPRSARTSASRAPMRPTRSSRQHCARRGSSTGCSRSPTASTRKSASVAASSPAVSGSASPWRGHC
jgi:ABC-type transport system involved in cytochrome bd biosynthesis fused ATPase/permease subunit